MNFEHAVKVHIDRLAVIASSADHPGMEGPEQRDNGELREQIKRFMESRELKPTPWGEKSGLARGTLSNFLNGKTRTLHRESLEKLARNQKVSISELTEDAPLDDGVTTDIVDSHKSEDAMNQQLIVQLLRQLTTQQDELLRQIVAQQEEANRHLAALSNKLSALSAPSTITKKAS